MNIGIFGGTFNPPHNGHLIAAEAVREKIGMDKVLFIPSYISPHKQEGEESISGHRLAMTKIAVRNNVRFEVIELELNLKETSYTVTTLKLLKNEYLSDKFFLILGMDNYLTFHQWKDYQKILELSTLVVMNRPNFPKQQNTLVEMSKVLFVDVPNVNISSSDIRQNILQGISVHELVPPDVEKYIITHSLYK
jgi:nicotinate-nucleotide adenylyltransferase